jgi:hypothetical protein
LFYANLTSHYVILLPNALLQTTMNTSGIGRAAGQRCSQAEEAAAGDGTGDSKNKAATEEQFY